MLGYGLGSGTGATRVLATDTDGRFVSLGHRLTVLRDLAVGMRELGEGGQTGEAVTSMNGGASQFFNRRL